MRRNYGNAMNVRKGVRLNDCGNLPKGHEFRCFYCPPPPRRVYDAGLTRPDEPVVAFLAPSAGFVVLIESKKGK
jgi:hypothetical protein